MNSTMHAAPSVLRHSGQPLRALLTILALGAAATISGCQDAPSAELEADLGDEDIASAEQAVVGAPIMGNARCNDRVKLKSWKGDYLHRPDSPQGVTTWRFGIGNVWILECLANGNIQLRSWKGDYLHRPDSPQGVTTWSFGEWTVVPTTGGRFMLKSWKGDYLHRPDSPQGVTTWDQGEWTAEVAVLGDAACNDQVRLRSWKGDYLNRPDSDAEPRVTTDGQGAAARNTWTVECKPNGNIQLRSWRGDYLHRPDSPQGVTTWDQGEWTVEHTAEGFMLRSWKGDYLHRPDSPQGVTTWNFGQWTAELAVSGGQALAEHYFPANVRTAAGEDCVAPARDGQKTGVAFYDIGPHPRNPGALMISYGLAFRQDCGHAGHTWGHGVEGHPGDIEYFFETLTPDSSCSTGYRLHAIKTVAHSGDYQRREVNESILDTCDPPSEIVLSLGKHAVYLSWLDCTKRTPAEVCLGGGSIGFNLHGVDANVAALFPPEGGAALDKIWNAQGDGKFCGGMNIGNRGDCVSAPEGKLTRPQRPYSMDEWELPDPDLGDDHRCPYGLDWSAGLCYKNCDPGYTGEMTMCIPGCPSGFRDDGLFCAKPDPYGRGVGYPWEFSDFPDFNLDGAYSRCEDDHGYGNCESCLEIVYPKCDTNFHAVGCNICSPDCPSNMTDIGVSCAKHTYDRGIGCLP